MPDNILSGQCFVQEPLLLEVAAPDFSADAYYRGNQIEIKLSDFKKSWVVLFFYAADFTFV